MSRNRTGDGARPDFPEGAAVVIGGSGGVGRSICQGLARSGTDVVLTFRDHQSAASEAAEAIRAAGRRADLHRLSVDDAAAVTSFFEGVVADHGRIHTVVNATGANISMRFIGEVALEEWRAVIESDLNGFFNVVRASLPHLRDGGGSYVVVSSVGLRRWPARDVLSVAPKAAIEAVVRGIASEEGRFGIRANSVALGVIETGIFLRLKGKDFGREWMEAARNNTALKRFGTAEEVSEAVVFLASARASYVTGQMLVLDGGYSI
jgi:NAD(P)-dependent dehydrogenase (short-subunit alcohol dehydrogenase family)